VALAFGVETPARLMLESAVVVLDLTDLAL
jgi:hypothetical protein